MKIFKAWRGKYGIKVPAIHLIGDVVFALVGINVVLIMIHLHVITDFILHVISLLGGGKLNVNRKQYAVRSH